MLKKIKLVFYLVSFLFLLGSCTKENILIENNILQKKIFISLKDSVNVQLYSNLNSNSIITYQLDLKTKLFQLFSNDTNKVIFVVSDNNGRILKGYILDLYGNFINKNVAKSFNGIIKVSNLKESILNEFSIKNNYLIKNSNKNVISTFTTNKIKSNETMIDAPDGLPEVLVVGYRSNQTPIFITYFNLLDIVGVGDYNEYVPIAPPDNGGSDNNDIILVNFDNVANKDSINVKKYLSCFENISNSAASYSITISAALPVENDPSKFTDINDAGHAFITLTKSSSFGESISQVIGFYPSTQNSALTGYTDSKIVNDENHIANASFTLNINSNQFQNALLSIDILSNKQYNLITNNCTNFALSVFNSAGGNLSISPYAVPNPFTSFITSQNNVVNLMYTPNQLYLSIKSLHDAGVSSASITKSFAISSHGPCF